ncbi:MAG: serine--tRNA ligase, partial [Desulfobacterales bacterium]|nr:serine--tRNA ligase [Desulfobacterales bacterium]
MLDIKFIRQNINIVEKALTDRGEDFDIKTFQIIDEKRRSILSEIEMLRHRKNVASVHVAQMIKKAENKDNIVSEMRSVSDKIKILNDELAENEETVSQILYNLPNIPHFSVPIGKDSSQNPIVKKVGNIPQFEFEQKYHWDLGEKLKIFDFERAAKITGARFPLYIGAGAKLERALINYMLDLHTTQHGYTEILPPFMVNRLSMTNTGQL